MSEHHMEDDSYFVSMTDLMVGILFIFIILLMWFALNFQVETSKLTDTENTRKQMLEEIQSALSNRGVKVEVIDDAGILRLPEELLFDVNKDVLEAEGVEAVRKLREVLEQVLPCYAQVPGVARSSDCSNKYHGRLESMLIEGHTDSSGEESWNWRLSSRRAMAVYNLLMGSETLPMITNTKPRPEPLIAISAYGERRPLNQNATPEERRENRRIDLRFIMELPKRNVASSPLAQTPSDAVQSRMQ